MAMEEKIYANPIFLLIFSFFCSLQLLYPSSVAAISTIRAGEELNSTSTLDSENGNFTLGYFTVIRPGAMNWSYFGIWYTNDNERNKVWVANPNQPITGSSAVLAIDNTGTLRITSEGITVIELYVPNVAGGATATLENNGNFVQRAEVDRRTLWQSFDYPTNTLLPGMKLGYNLTSRQNWTLNSWVNGSNPAPGAFTLGLESIEGGGQLVIRLRGEVYWTSGPWINNSNFLYTPAFTSPFNRYQYNIQYVLNEDGEYFTFDAADANFTMLILQPEGLIFERASRQVITAYGEFCYGYESDNGCAVNTSLPRCRSQRDSFQLMQGSFRPGRTRSSEDNSITQADCMESCWSNCDCVGFRYNEGIISCIHWFGDNEFEINPAGNGVDRYVLVSERSSRDNTWRWIVISVAIFLGLFTLGGALCYVRMRKRRLQGEEKQRREDYLNLFTASESFNNGTEVENNMKEGGDLNIFTFASIAAATNNFSSENKLGQGGFGPVYKGQLLEGRKIAVKRLSRTSGQGLVEFKNELILIAKLQHTNLVRVLGCCIHGSEKMLIYEYMPNKSLDFFLFDSTKRGILDWKKRFSIIEGIAQGLLYLHRYSRMRVIHRDLKASNVLLDENMNPKISDFGMARIFKSNVTEAITNRVVGTYGYMSPEYAMEGVFSIKSDVFSFGVLILEIVSGRKNNNLYHLDRPLNLIGYAWELWKEGGALELKDPILEDSRVVGEQVLRTIHVGLLCVQEDATERPTMGDVISALSNETMGLPAPRQPAFFTGRSNNIVVKASSTSSSETRPLTECSVNGLTISQTEPR